MISSVIFTPAVDAFFIARKLNPAGRFSVGNDGVVALVEFSWAEQAELAKNTSVNMAIMLTYLIYCNYSFDNLNFLVSFFLVGELGGLWNGNWHAFYF